MSISEAQKKTRGKWKAQPMRYDMLKRSHDDSSFGREISISLRFLHKKPSRSYSWLAHKKTKMSLELDRKRRKR